MCLVLRTPYGGPAGKIIQSNPSSPIPLWRTARVLARGVTPEKKGFWRYGLKRGSTVHIYVLHSMYCSTCAPVFLRGSDVGSTSRGGGTRHLIITVTVTVLSKVDSCARTVLAACSGAPPLAVPVVAITQMT